MDQENATYTQAEYYLAFKRKEILQSAETWVNLEDIVPSERSRYRTDVHLYG